MPASEVRLYPAIDIRDGHAVRLVQGDYRRQTVFDADPLDAARRWVADGADALHVVDLDGARTGEPAGLEHLARICAEVDAEVQFGGGVRSAESAELAFEAGADRVVLGTAAIADPALVEALADEHPGRVVASVDARGGRVAVEGWEREAEVTPATLVGELAQRGVRRFLHTPVEVDGTLEGPALDALRPVATAAEAAGCELLYSGGIGSLDDLRALRSLDLDSLAGVIVGRALYEARFTVADAQAALAAPR